MEKDDAAAWDADAAAIKYKIAMEKDDDLIKCPACRSTQITANKKGFGLGKAVVGGVLLGGVGLLGGFL